MKQSYLARLELVVILLALALAACGSPPVTNATRAQACLFLTSCGGMGTLGSVGDCAGGLEESALRHSSATDSAYLAQVAACGMATSCSGFHDCLSIHHGRDYCRAHPGSTCDGNVVVRCSAAGDATAEDCAQYGSPCTMANGAAACATNRPCDLATDRDHCVGNRLVWCDMATHLESEVDCTAGAPDWTCVQDVSVGGCAPPGVPCAGNTVRCDGSVIVACLLGRERRDDCAAVGGRTCVANGGAATCVLSGPVCGDTTPDTCIGTMLQTCVDGTVTPIDCASLGFRTCVPGATGGNAYCSM